MLKMTEKYIDITVCEDKSYLEKVLLDAGISKKVIRRYYSLRRIYVNGSFKRKDLPIYKNDVIRIYYENEKENINADNIDLNIIYEDECLIILNKKSGEITHTNYRYQNNTLENGLRYYFNKKGINQKVRLINRLDKDTSGLIIVAKNIIIAGMLSDLIRKNEIQRKYKLLVHNSLEEEGYIIKPILKIDGVMKRKIDINGKNSITKYKVLERKKNFTLIEAELITGRGHQLRIHFSSIGNPILGDKIYGIEDDIGKLQLYSNYLKFNNPINGSEMEFCLDFPNSEIVNI